MILFILPNISRRTQVHNETERMLACRPPSSRRDIRRYCFWWGVWSESTEIQTFWEMFGLGQITQNVTCTICSSVTTRVEPFSKLLLQFPESHHEATPTNWKCTLNSLIGHYHIRQANLPNYDCNYCGKRTLATRRVQISWYPVILCIVLGCKKNDDNRATLAVGYPVWDLNPCTIFG